MVVKKINIVLLVLLLSSPCVNFWSYDPRFLDWQAVYVKFIVLLLAILNLCGSMIKKGVIRISRIDCIVGCVFAVLLCRVFFTDVFSLKNETFTWLLVYLLLYLSLRGMEEQVIEGMINSLFPILALILCIYGLMQFAGVIRYSNPFFKMGGTFVNPSMFTNFLCLLLPIAVCRIVYPTPGESNRTRLVVIASAMVTMVVLLLGGERSSWMGMFAGILLIMGKKSTMPGLKKISIAMSIVIASALALYFLRMSSALGRLLIYRTTLTIIERNLLFGIGPGKFPSVYPLYQAAYFKAGGLDNSFQQVADNVTFAFNEYLQFVCEVGLPALLLIALALWYLIKAIKYSYKGLGRGISLAICGAIGSIAVVAFFSYPFRDPVILSFVLILVSTVRCGGEKPIEITLRSLPRLLLLSFFLVAIVGISGLTISIATAQYQWSKIAHSREDSSRKLEEYGKLYGALDSDAFFLYNYGVELSLSGRYAESIGSLERGRRYFTNSDLVVYLGDDYLGISNYGKAKQQYEEAAAMVPKRFLPKYALMQYYQTVHNEMAADSLAERILTEKVNYPSHAISIIKDQAFDLLKNCKDQ